MLCDDTTEYITEMNTAQLHDVDSCFDDLLSDACNISITKVEKQTSKTKNARRSSSTLILKSELDKFCYLPLEPRKVDSHK